MSTIQVTTGQGWFDRRYEVHLTNEERCKQTNHVKVADVTIFMAINLHPGGFSDACWAGDGSWNGEQIEDCSAILPEEDYDKIDKAIAAWACPDLCLTQQEETI